MFRPGASSVSGRRGSEVARNSSVTGFEINVGGGGGAGASLLPWIDLSLDPADYAVYGVGSDWTVALVAGKLRATRLTTPEKDWCNTAEQNGVVLIRKLPVNPFPVEAVPGLTGDTWRGEYATLKVYSKLAFGTALAAPIRGHAGPGIVSYTNDQGGSPAGPPFSDIAAEPSWYYVMHVDQSDNASVYGWNEGWGGNNDCGYHPGVKTPAFGSAGQTNRMEIAVSQGRGIGATGTPSDNSIGMLWLDDTDATVPADWARGYAPNETTATVRVDGKYLHPAHFFGSWGPQQVGDYVEVSEWKYMVQQFPQRGAES